MSLGLATTFITTVWGLLVAIPAKFFSQLLRVRISNLSMDLSTAALGIVRSIRSV